MHVGLGQINKLSLYLRVSYALIVIVQFLFSFQTCAYISTYTCISNYTKFPKLTFQLKYLLDLPLGIFGNIIILYLNYFNLRSLSTIKK